MLECVMGVLMVKMVINNMSYEDKERDNWWFGNEIESYEVLNYIREFFDYDHEYGRLRWTCDRRMWERLPASMKRKAQQGRIAGGCRKGYDYEIKVDGVLRNALTMIWEHQTSNSRRRIMTIKPGETRFSIDNICLIPKRKQRAPKYRAKGLTVVSWSHERKQYTTVNVDIDYNKHILSYHDNIDSAIKAIDNPEVSFL